MQTARSPCLIPWRRKAMPALVFMASMNARLMVELFFGLVELSDGPMAAERIKFHLRSLADKPLFAAINAPLPRGKLFQQVEVRGMWMYLTKV
jgi:hypothetical protein